mmetsp:Transcript_44866/g.54318  ORF Transcript_44866/g.54318 Transcript_44866/m.54318 type:complete len:498 (+) Transcript_44866:104-1597(+)|eukprot:CAMPEP_0172501016 /NCGR_PEP_ID=MMETSP1066-20121228/145186_1 /TAXON_ID=671091 /ORGANISM="Coscinodiscus wailesii, Strain CCMP2513" /LENGTH=497 /DNA_ID=CAMNT_0013275575 /DNA_START=101 /DNA_END=1594 /DNA_ORIENTATION=-
MASLLKFGARRVGQGLRLEVHGNDEAPMRRTQVVNFDKVKVSPVRDLEILSMDYSKARPASQSKKASAWKSKPIAPSQQSNSKPRPPSKSAPKGSKSSKSASKEKDSGSSELAIRQGISTEGCEEWKKGIIKRSDFSIGIRYKYELLYNDSKPNATSPFQYLESAIANSTAGSVLNCQFTVDAFTRRTVRRHVRRLMSDGGIVGVESGPHAVARSEVCQNILPDAATAVDGSSCVVVDGETVAHLNRGFYIEHIARDEILGAISDRMANNTFRNPEKGIYKLYYVGAVLPKSDDMKGDGLTSVSAANVDTAVNNDKPFTALGTSFLVFIVISVLVAGFFIMRRKRAHRRRTKFARAHEAPADKLHHDFNHTDTVPRKGSPTSAGGEGKAGGGGGGILANLFSAFMPTHHDIFEVSSVSTGLTSIEIQPTFPSLWGKTVCNDDSDNDYYINNTSSQNTDGAIGDNRSVDCLPISQQKKLRNYVSAHDEEGVEEYYRDY